MSTPFPEFTEINATPLLQLKELATLDISVIINSVIIEDITKLLISDFPYHADGHNPDYIVSKIKIELMKRNLISSQVKLASILEEYLSVIVRAISKKDLLAMIERKKLEFDKYNNKLDNVSEILLSNDYNGKELIEAVTNAIISVD